MDMHFSETDYYKWRPLIYYIARRHYEWAYARPEDGHPQFIRRRIDKNDLLQAGAIGLIYAHKFFKPDRGVDFKTYAYVCIRREMRSELKQHFALISYSDWDKIRLHGSADANKKLDQALNCSLFSEVSDSQFEEIYNLQDHRLLENSETADLIETCFEKLANELPERLFSILERRAAGQLQREIATTEGVSTQRISNLLQLIHFYASKVVTVEALDNVAWDDDDDKDL